MSRARRILVVDDEPAVRATIVRHLLRRGFDVHDAGSAETALLQSFRETDPFDLILTDVHLPNLSGVDLTRIILAHSPLRPVILITGDPDETIAREAFTHGASGYLLKPFELFELDFVVDQALSRLTLLESTQAIATADAARQRESAPGMTVPSAWLAVADERSGAGAGHGLRVARLCGAIVAALPERMEQGEQRSLELAARAHELGRLLGASEGGAALAARSAHFLAALKLDPGAVRTVSRMQECWLHEGEDSADGPIPLPAQILGVADAIDHWGTRMIAAGERPTAAASAATAQVVTATRDRLSPVLSSTLEESRETLEALWLLVRGSQPG